MVIVRAMMCNNQVKQGQRERNIYLQGQFGMWMHQSVINNPFLNRQYKMFWLNTDSGAISYIQETYKQTQGYMHTQMDNVYIYCHFNIPNVAYYSFHLIVCFFLH